MSNFKTYSAVAIMIGCFVVIYPRFMHPIFLNILGMKDPPKPEGNTYNSPGHKGHPHERGPRGEAEEMRKHMRHGPHPGMRAAAEMQRQHGQQGSGRGMMGVVLPMYAVGIVLYLAYTLYKVFNKNNSKENTYSSGSGRYGRDRYKERDGLGFPKDFDTNQDIRNFLHDQQHRENLEDLLTRVDDKNVSVEEMRVLQKRLEETEAQMTRILNAMHAVNANMDNLKNSEADPNEGKEEGKETQEESQPTDPAKDAGTTEDDNKVTETGAANDEHTKGDKTKEDNSNAENDDVVENDQANVEEEKAVDELIEERKDDENKDEINVSNVRQRNVKSNEQ